MTQDFHIGERSWMMKAVKSSGNKSTELKIIQIFKQFGVTGWRRNYKLFGKPDFVFLKKRVVFFVDGCFWHGHRCIKNEPKNNTEYWRKKIQRNKKRDRLVGKTLAQKGWRVIRVWECELKTTSLPSKLNALLDNCRGGGGIG